MLTNNFVGFVNPTYVTVIELWNIYKDDNFLHNTYYQHVTKCKCEFNIASNSMIMPNRIG